jgi:hypothetical protein
LHAVYEHAYHRHEVIAFLLLSFAAAPDLVSRELEVSAIPAGETAPVRKKIKLLHPSGWSGDDDLDASYVRLFGPNGEGELLVAVVLTPDALGEHLTRLKNAHPSAAPSPPQFIEVKGIDPQKGERATRFEITGREVGEMVMIERGGVIVLYAAIVSPDAWPDLKTRLQKCYPSVKVSEGPRLRVEKAPKK